MSSPNPRKATTNNNSNTKQNGGMQATSSEPGATEPGAGVAARRQKAMSIGNAAALFGTASSPSEDSSGGSGDAADPSDFFGQFGLPKKSGASSPVSVKSPFASVAEEAGPPQDDVAGLFGGNGQDATPYLQGDSQQQDWLASIGSGSNGHEQYDAGSQYHQQQASYDYQTATQDQTAAYQADPNAQAQYAYYDQQPDISNFNQSMYYDPASQQQYQQSLHAQAGHGYSAPAAQTSYDYSGQQNYAAGYGQQYSQSYQQDPASNAYLPQDTQYSAYGQTNHTQHGQPATAFNQSAQWDSYQQPTAEQGAFVPFSAPAATASGAPMTYSQGQSAQRETPYAPNQPNSTQSYDPYALQQAQSQQAYSATPYQQPGAGDPYAVAYEPHARPQSASSSAMQASTSSQSTQAGTAQPNRPDLKGKASKGSFFADLPTLPSSKARTAGSLRSTPQISPQIQQAPVFAPPPPKSRTPVPPPARTVSRSSNSAQRPSSRTSILSPTAPAPFAPSRSSNEYSEYSNIGSRTSPSEEFDGRTSIPTSSAPPASAGQSRSSNGFAAAGVTIATQGRPGEFVSSQQANTPSYPSSQPNRPNAQAAPLNQAKPIPQNPLQQVREDAVLDTKEAIPLSKYAEVNIPSSLPVATESRKGHRSRVSMSFNRRDVDITPMHADDDEYDLEMRAFQRSVTLDAYQVQSPRPQTRSSATQTEDDFPPSPTMQKSEELRPEHAITSRQDPQGVEAAPVQANQPVHESHTVDVSYSMQRSLPVSDAFSMGSTEAPESQRQAQPNASEVTQYASDLPDTAAPNDPASSSQMYEYAYQDWQPGSSQLHEDARPDLQSVTNPHDDYAASDSQPIASQPYDYGTANSQPAPSQLCDYTAATSQFAVHQPYEHPASDVLSPSDHQYNYSNPALHTTSDIYPQVKQEPEPEPEFPAPGHSSYDPSPYDAVQSDPWQYQQQYDSAPSNPVYSSSEAPLAKNANETYTAAHDYQPSHELPSATSRTDVEAQRKVPAVSFGFDGKLVTFFGSNASFSASAGAAVYGTPYEQSSLSTSSKAPVTIHSLGRVLESDTSSLSAFPGPLFMDSGATTASGKTKKKKDIISWLDDKIDQTSKAVGFISAIGPEPGQHDAADAVILLKLLKIMLEHDGKLSGSATIDESVRAVLVPGMSGPAGNSLPVATNIGSATSTSEAGGSRALQTDMYHLQGCLLHGDKQAAVYYALDRKLFAHAMLIAIGMDKAMQGTVLKEFVQAELHPPNGTGLESLAVAYSLFSGQNPQSVIAPSTGPAQQSAGTYSNGAGQLFDWCQAAAMVIANRQPGDSDALRALSERLATERRYKAAQACSLLASGTTNGAAYLLNGEVPLLGASPASGPLMDRDLNAIMLSEILEFAFSLIPVAKGQEPYVGMTHLQSHRLVHAMELADAGLHVKAQKYCDAISATMKLATKGSPHYHPAMLAQVKELSDRLSMVGFQDKSGSWISRKVQKPTLDNVWSTLEGRFTKFVAGESEEPNAADIKRKQEEEASKAVAGPFAHYSSITPIGPESVSRAPSVTDFARMTPPPQPVSVPNTASREQQQKKPAATHHRRSSSYGFGPYGADPYPPYQPQMADIPSEEPENEPSYDLSQHNNGYNNSQGTASSSNWWDYTNNSTNNYDPNTAGAPAMYNTSESSTYGYEPQPSTNSAQTQTQPYSRQYTPSSSVAAPPTIEEEDDDDLGLGNSSNKRRREQPSGVKDSEHDSAAQKPSTADQVKKEDDKALKASPSSSWLGKWFRRDGGSPSGGGPIRAKLGEETSFVYDPVEKRWVNKKAGSSSEPTPTPTPPPRASTASPTLLSQGRMSTPPPPAPLRQSVGPGVPPSSRSATNTPPPPPATAAAGTSSSSAPPKAGELPPPPRRPATTTGGGSRKNVRARYVDVLAQQNS